MSRVSMIQEKTCPICRNSYKYVEKRPYKACDRTQYYYYIIHISKDANGRKHVKKCYIGAEGYIYVSKMHKDANITFTGYNNPNRYNIYMKDIMDYIDRDKTHGENIRRVRIVPI